MRSAELNDRLDTLARLADGISVVILHQRRKLAKDGRRNGRGVRAHRRRTANIALRPLDLSSVMRGDARHNQRRKCLGGLSLDERVPVVGRLLQHCHAVLEVRAKCGAGVLRHLAKSGDGTFLGFEEGCSHVEDVVALLVLFLRIIQAGKLSSLTTVRIEVGK